MFKNIEKMFSVPYYGVISAFQGGKPFFDFLPNLFFREFYSAPLVVDFERTLEASFLVDVYLNHSCCC